jgi:rhodanese-related sulfurtransferase/DNA-binding transcriptional ArsR family regulator
MKGREFKNAIYEGLAKLMKALSNPARLEIIEMLSQGEKSVEGIVDATNLTIANASQHLQVLRNNNIVKSRKNGHYVFYSLVSYELLALYQHITKYAITEIAALEKVLTRQREDNKASNSVSLNELEEMITNKNVLLMDVRPSAEYEFGHITGAISVPMNDLLCCLKDFSKAKQIIAYCRGPFCVLADEAVRVLTENGFNVRRLDEGYPEWKMKHVSTHSEE